jgi:hypothetical protein
MSALTVNTDAYSRLKVPGANAARLVDEWADSCASSQDEFKSKALLIAVDGFEGPTLTANERGWLEEYVRQLPERFPGLVEDVIVCSPDHDPELRILVLIREGDREAEKKVSALGHTIDMSGFFVAPLIRVLTVTEWEKRKLAGAQIFFNAAEREGVSVL